jgi:hypothetical protein
MVNAQGWRSICLVTHPVEAWLVFGDYLRVPKPEALLKRGMRWTPFSSVTSWYLWRTCDLAKDTASASR